MYLLDTNHCSRAILKDSQVLNRLNEINSNIVATCVITQGELIDMAERSQHNKSNLALVQNFLQGIYIYPIDRTTATKYGQLKASIFKQFAPKDMKQTIIYLPEETETNLQELANQTGKSVSELIQEVITNYLTQKAPKLPKSVGMGASGRTDLSSTIDELLWTEE